MPDVVPERFIWLVFALNVRLVVVLKFNAAVLKKEQVIVDPFKLIVLVFVLLEINCVQETA